MMDDEQQMQEAVRQGQAPDERPERARPPHILPPPLYISELLTLGEAETLAKAMNVGVDGILDQSAHNLLGNVVAELNRMRKQIAAMTEDGEQLIEELHIYEARVKTFNEHVDEVKATSDAIHERNAQIMANNRVLRATLRRDQIALEQTRAALSTMVVQQIAQQEAEWANNLTQEVFGDELADSE